MTGVSFGAAADGSVVLNATISPNAACSVARIGTFQIETGLVTPAFVMLGTLGVASSERIAQEIKRARTDSTVVQDSAFGVGTTCGTRVGTAVVDAGLVATTDPVAFAFVSAAIDGVANISLQT